MESFISILSIQTNSLTNENVVVGLLVVSSKKVFFEYSKSKIQFAQKISGSNELGILAQNSLKKIELLVNVENSEQKKLFSKSLFNSAYIEYLTDYSAGALKFSTPIQIKKVFDDKSFYDYYHKFVGEILNPKKSSSTFKASVKKYFHKVGLEEKADISFKLNPIDFKGLFNETTLPLITKNGSVTAVQLIDFESSKEVCANNLYIAKSVYYGLTNFCKSKLDVHVSKMKIVCTEPELSSESHKVFELANNETSEFFEFINPDELDSYTDQILNSNYKKFSSLLQALK